ncbi:unnamed protein product [Brassica oleracea]
MYTEETRERSRRLHIYLQVLWLGQRVSCPFVICTAILTTNPLTIRYMHKLFNMLSYYECIKLTEFVEDIGFEW